MNDLLKRNSYDDGSVEASRIIAFVAVLIVLAGVWHGLRSTLVHRFAVRSLGCPGREELLREALRQKGFDMSDAQYLRAYSLPRPGWIAWETASMVGTLPGRSQRAAYLQTTLVDGRLRLIGKLREGLYSSPADIDGDGRWEVHLEAPASKASTSPGPVYDAVLRLGATANDLIWLGLRDDSSWRSRGIRIIPRWEDADGDGVLELAFNAAVIARWSSGLVLAKPLEIVSSFKLDRPGGILRPAIYPDDCGLTLWNPPGNAPVVLEQDADLESVFRELLPVPQ